jgi:hypothetical protein
MSLESKAIAPVDTGSGPDAELTNRAGNGRLVLTLKLLVAAGLFALLFSQVGLRDLWNNLSAARPGPLWLAVFFVFANLVISGYKWQLLLEVHGLRYPAMQIQRWFLIASFLSQCLPSTIGGDAYRIYKTLGNPRHRACSVLAVFMHRLTGMASWLVLGYVAVVVVYLRDGTPLMGALAVAGAVAGAVGLVGLVLTIRLSLTDRIVAHRWCPSALASLIRYSGDYRHAPGRMTVVMAASFIYHVQRVGLLWLAIRALGSDFDPLHLTASLVAADAVGMLPISLGGLGTMDAALVYLLGYFGLGHAIGLSAVLLVRGLTIPTMVVGGLVYLAEGKVPANRAIVPNR